MNCRYCHKTLDVIDGYCPYCGVATKLPTETENRKKPDNLVFGVVLLIILIVLFICGAAIRFSLLWLVIMLAIALFWVGPTIYDTIKGRNLPLIKRIAVVATARYVESGDDQGFYITFAFPDNTCLEFRVTESFAELAQGDRIILKYKKIGKFEHRLVSYGYERLEEKPKE